MTKSTVLTNQFLEIIFYTWKLDSVIISFEIKEIILMKLLIKLEALLSYW